LNVANDHQRWAAVRQVCRAVFRDPAAVIFCVWMSLLDSHPVWFIVGGFVALPIATTAAASGRHDDLVVSVQIDVEDLGHLADQVLMVITLGFQDVDRCHDVDVLREPSLLIVLDKTFHRSSLPGCPNTLNNN
jgi:hypothetical protein